VADTKAHDACLKIISLTVGMVRAGQLAWARPDRRMRKDSQATAPGAACSIREGL